MGIDKRILRKYNINIKGLQAKGAVGTIEAILAK